MPHTQDMVPVDQGAMVGIVMLVTKELEVITVTENISTILGISTVDILGNNLCDFLHPCDHSALQTLFSSGTAKHQVALRLRNLLGDRGRVVSMRQAGYKVVCIVPVLPNTMLGGDPDMQSAAPQWLPCAVVLPRASPAHQLQDRVPAPPQHGDSGL